MENIIYPIKDKLTSQHLWRFIICTLLALVLFQGIFGVIGFTKYIGEPFGGFLITWQKESRHLIVSPLTGSSWPGIQPDHLRPNDQLLGIGGVSLRTLNKEDGMEAIEKVQREVRPASGQQAALNYLVSRDGAEIIIHNVPIVRLTLPMFLEAELPPFTFGLGFWIIALVIFQSQPDHETNRVSAVLAIFVAAIAFQSSLYSNLINASVPNDRWATVTLWSTIPLVGAILIHWASLFPAPEETPRLMRGRYVWYLPATIATLVNSVVYIWPHFSWSPRLYQFVLSGFFLPFLGFGFIFTGMRYRWLYLHSSSQRVKHQTQILFWGWAFGVILPVTLMLAYSLFNLFGVRLVNNISFLSWLYLLSIAYTILRYQVFPNRTRRLLYLVVVAIGVILATGYFYGLRVLTPTSLPIFPLLLVTLLTSIFWTMRPVRGPLHDFFARLLHRERGDLQAIVQLSEALHTHAADLQAMLNAVADNLYNTLEVKHLHVWLAPITHAEEGTLTREIQLAAAQINPSKTTVWPDEFTLSAEQVRFFLTVAAPLRVAASRTLLPKTVQTEAIILLPLIHRSQLIGLGALGPRWTEEVYSSEDLMLLETMSRQIAAAILAALQIAELRQFTQRVAEAQEKERERLSKELHDSTQQFLAGLPFTLAASQKLCQSNSQKAVETLQFCIDHARVQSVNLKAIRRHLSPGALIERGLIGALQLLIHESIQQSKVNITFESQGEIEQVISNEVCFSLYRMMQQALENALKHSGGDSISLSLQRAGDRIRFTVEDNGCGFAVKDTLQRLREGHDGLHIMRDRALISGGEFHVHSVLKKGTVISGSVPVKVP